MLDRIGQLFSVNGFMPHGMCYLWRPDILILHVVSDALITLAYFSIPFTLLYFVRKRTDLQFDWMFVCFAIFIVACGTTHFMEIWTVWHPMYWLSGSIKAITALASVPTALLLIKLIPVALRLPSPSALQTANTELARQVAERKRAEDEVRRMNEQLEARVAERTAELRSSEQLLRESEERLRTLAEMLPHLVWTCRPDGWCDYVSRRWVEYTGRSEDEQLGSGWTEHLHPNDVERVRGEWATATARGEPFDMEFRVRRADGAQRWFKMRAVPLRDGAGAIVKWFGSNTDVHDYKLTEQALRTQLEKLALLDRTTRAIGDRQDPGSILGVVLRSLEDSLTIDFAFVCLSRENTGILTVARVGANSRALAQQLAMTEETQIPIDQNGLARCMLGQLVHEPDITGSAFALPHRLASGGLGSLVIAPLTVESRIFGAVIAARREVGAFSSSDCEFLRQLSEHVALVLHQAELHSALQRAYDDLRQTQQSVVQQERLRALGQMASGIAHDINNSISPISLYTESLLEREPNLSHRARGFLTVIQRAIDDVAATVARMREFYRPREPESGMARIDVNRLIGQVVDLTRARWSDLPQQRGIVIELHTELTPDVAHIMGAETEIRDALVNLVFNAVDAMPEGGVLTLRTFGASVESQVCIEVTDTGIGMDEQTRQNCLEPFFTTKGERGTGLGLAMVYGMAQRHRAELELESEPGLGTTIRLRFPGYTAATDSSAPQRSAMVAHQQRILLVDDDPRVLGALKEMLESDGHRVAVADGGQAGIEAFSAAAAAGRGFDIVITDLGMPYVDGRKVAAAIKGLSNSTPIVMLTGWGHRLIAEADIPPHVDRVLNKPPRMEEIRMTLAELTA